MDGAIKTWAYEVLGHRFQQPALLEEALTHTTFSNEHPGSRPNQRLEFLGDAVLGLVVAQAIYERYAGLAEGDLTKIRAAVVCEPSLAARARHLNLGQQMRFGKGESVGGRDRDSTMADTFEAVVGAIYLDAGLDAARTLVLRELSAMIDSARQGLVRVDYKTRLQERLQREGDEGPVYRLLDEEGPAHEKRFQVGVYHRERLLGSGWGRSKKEAEQVAAQEALEQ